MGNDTKFIRRKGFAVATDDQSTPFCEFTKTAAKVTGSLTIVNSSNETLQQLGGSSANTVFNESGADVDFRVETDGNANAFSIDAGVNSGVGAVAIGQAAVADQQFTVTHPAVTATAATNYYTVAVEADAAVTVPTGTTAVVASLNVAEPNITATGTVTDACTVRIADAPTEGGTGNYALWVDAGLTRLDGNATLGALTLGAAAPTNPQAFIAVLPPANASGITANQSYHHAQVLPGGATTIPAGTAPVVSSMNVTEPNITATGTVSDAVTFRVQDAPTEGTRNYSLWVDAGVSRFDDTVVISAGTNLAEPTGMTVGLFIEQAGNDDSAVMVSSTDVTHGVTDLLPTNTYGDIRKVAAADGGLRILGITDVTESVIIYGVATTEDTTDAPTTSSKNTVNVRAGIKSGTGGTTHQATGNLFGVQDNDGTNEFIVKGDGELYSNQSATVGTFDSYEDAVLSWDLAHYLGREYDKMLKYNKDTFVNAKILSEGVDERNGKPYRMVSLTKMNQLLLCTVGQLHQQIEALKNEVKGLVGLNRKPELPERGA